MFCHHFSLFLAQSPDILGLSDFELLLKGRLPLYGVRHLARSPRAPIAMDPYLNTVRGQYSSVDIARELQQNDLQEARVKVLATSLA